MTRQDEKTRSKEYETPEPKAKCKNPPLLPFQNGAKKEPLRIKAAAGSEMGSSQMHLNTWSLPSMVNTISQQKFGNSNLIGCKLTLFLRQLLLIVFKIQGGNMIEVTSRTQFKSVGIWFASNPFGLGWHKLSSFSVTWLVSLPVAFSATNMDVNWLF